MNRGTQFNLFEAGCFIIDPSEIIFDRASGEYYRWDGKLPKQVLAGSTPQSTGGIDKGAWVSVGDASLRGDLKNINGSSLVGHGDTTVKEKLDGIEENISPLFDQVGFNQIGRFLNVEKLREHKPVNIGMIVYVASSYSEADDEHHYGGGYFQSFDNSASPVEDDGGIVIIPATGNIAWRRINFTSYDMCFWGVKPDGKTDNAEAITRATDYAKENHVELIFPSGIVKSSESFPVYSDMSLRGSGRDKSVFSKTTNNKYKATATMHIDALLVMVPDDNNANNPCSKSKIEGITFQRDSLTKENLCHYGMWSIHLAAPIIRDVKFYGCYIGMYGEIWYLFESTSVQCFGIIGKSYAGVHIAKIVDGKYALSGTSLNFNLVSVLGFAVGFFICNMSYSSLTNCTGEYISRLDSEPGATVFLFINPYGVNMTGCSSEGADATLIRAEVADNMSGTATLVIDSYQYINDTNPTEKIRQYIVDSGGVGEINVTFIGGDIRTLRSNYLPPLASGSNCNVKVVGTATFAWDVLSGATYKEL